MQPVFSLNDKVGRADALDLRAHRDEHITQIDNFGLTRCIM